MASRNCWRLAGALTLFGLLCPHYSYAQGSAILAVAPPNKMTAKRGGAAETKLVVSLQEGYHANSNTPSEDYLIPMKLTWTPGTLEPAEVVFPKPHMEKYEFSPKPLSVYTGDFELISRFKVPAGAAPGISTMTGKLRYQACTNNMCFPPKTVEIKLPVEVR